MLDIAGLSHGDDTAVITDVEHAVLLEDRAEHVLHDDRRAGVADEAGLLVQLLGEEVDTEVAVLARRAAGRDANDLARTALQDEQVTDAHMVARDGDGVGHAGHPVGVAGGWGRAVVRAGLVGFGLVARSLDFAFLDLDGFLAVLYAVVFLVVGVRVRVVVVVSAVDGVEDAIRGTRETVAEGVVLAVLVVISHITLVLACGCVDRSSVGDFDVLVVAGRVTLGVSSGWVVARVGALVLPVPSGAVLLTEGNGAVTEVPLGDVDTGVGVEVEVGGWGVTSVVLAVLYVELGVGVAVVRLVVASEKPWSSVMMVSMDDGEVCNASMEEMEKWCREDQMEASERWAVLLVTTH